MTKISNWKIDPVTEDLLAPTGKRVRNIDTVIGTDAANADYVNNQISAAIAGGVQDGANIGGGAEVFESKAALNLQFRTLVGTPRIGVAEVGDTIEFSLLGGGALFNSGVGVTPVTVDSTWTTCASTTFAGLAAGNYLLDLYGIVQQNGNGIYGLRFNIAGSPSNPIQSWHVNDPCELSHSVPRVVTAWPGGNLTIDFQGWKVSGTNVTLKEWIARLQQL